MNDEIGSGTLFLSRNGIGVKRFVAIVKRGSNTSAVIKIIFFFLCYYWVPTTVC